MKKVFALTVACFTLSGCHYLGEPESYTLVDEERAPTVQQAPVQPIIHPTPAPYCGQTVCSQGACQINQGVAGPLTVTIPAQSVCIQ